MKRAILSGVLSLILLVSLLAFGACGSGAAEEPTPEPGEEFAAAINDMLQARTVASVLGAFTDGAANTNGADSADETAESDQQPAAPARRESPLDLGDVPTRSQFSIQVDSIALSGQRVQEVNTLRPGLDVTVYNYRDFYYIEGALRLLGMPFPVVNIGIDGSVISAKVPLIYERYFAVDVDTVLDELMNDSLFAGMMNEFDLGFNYFAEWLEYQNAASEAFAYAFDVENLLMGMLEDLLAVSQVEVDGDVYSLIIPAAEATAALATFWEATIDALEMIDLSSFMDMEITDADWAELRDMLNEIYFTQDVTLFYKIYNGNLLGVELEGVMGAESDDDEVRILVAYFNNSGDHVGDIKWVFEMESMNTADELFMRFEYTSTLDTTNGYARRDGFTLLFDDRHESFDMVLNWYLTRTADNRFNAGFELRFDDGFDWFDMYLFAQGAMAFGDDYFVFDLNRLGLELDVASEISFDIVLSMHFRHEAISASAVPTINPRDQFFVMDASDEELEAVWQQIEGNIEGLTAMFEMFGF